MPKKVVIVGGVAAGPKTASKIMRLLPDAEVTLVERGQFMSFAGCGLPYYVGDVIPEQKELMATPAGAPRDSAFFAKVKGFSALTRTEALEIDRDGRRLWVKSLESGEESWLPYDNLVLTTGASPIIPPIPGVDKRNVFALHKVEDSEGVRAAIAEGAKDAVIIGGGLIGVETAEALTAKGLRVTIVEMLDQILNMLDLDMAVLAAQHMTAKGVRVLTNTIALAMEDKVDSPGAVGAVKTSAGDIPADLVILAIGVRPNTDLARTAGIEVGSRTGAIVVDQRMRTSDPFIFAAGDCVESRHLVSGQQVFVPLGSSANKQGRVAAMNICGEDDIFPGVLGSMVCQVFDYCVGTTGLSEKAASCLGYDVIAVLSPAPDRAHYMPTNKPIMMKLVAQRGTRRLLGIQVAGPGAGDKRIDAAAMAITAGMTVDQVAQADISYAPPYNSAMDNLITACNIARNKLDGTMASVTPAEVKALLDDGADFIFLDARSPGEFDQVRLPQGVNIPLGAIRAKAADFPRDKEIITFCKISLRGYEAALILKGMGFTNVKYMDGGIAMWPYPKGG